MRASARAAGERRPPLRELTTAQCASLRFIFKIRIVACAGPGRRGSVHIGGPGAGRARRHARGGHARGAAGRGRARVRALPRAVRPAQRGRARRGGRAGRRIRWAQRAAQARGGLRARPDAGRGRGGDATVRCPRRRRAPGAACGAGGCCGRQSWPQRLRPRRRQCPVRAGMQSAPALR